jgi:hypothetical protein
MKKAANIKAVEGFGRVRFSESFFLRDFLHSEIADFFGIPQSVPRTLTSESRKGET